MKIEKLFCHRDEPGSFLTIRRRFDWAQSGRSGLYGRTCASRFYGCATGRESISVQMVLEDGQIAHGDCAAVQYSGASGRDPLFLAEDFIPVIEEHVVPVFEQTEITEFRAMADKLDAIRVDGKPLHTAISYGVSQALWMRWPKRTKNGVRSDCRRIWDRRFRQTHTGFQPDRRRPLYQRG